MKTMTECIIKQTTIESDEHSDREKARRQEQ